MNILVKQWLAINTVGIIAALLMMEGAMAGPIGFSVMSNGDDHLYQIDLLTGEAMDLNRVGTPGPTGFGDAEGLAFIGSQLYAIGGTREQLWNITEPPGEKVGDTGPRSGTEAGLAYDVTTDTLYNYQGSFRNGYLYKINPNSGEAILVGNNNQFADGLAINKAGEAFLIDSISAIIGASNSLYQLDLNTGSVSLIGSLGLTTLSNFGLSFDHSGILWGLNSLGEIYQIDTTTGAAQYTTNVTFDGNPLVGFEGLAVAPASVSVAEPISSTLLGVGLVGLGFSRRWRRSSRCALTS